MPRTRRFRPLLAAAVLLAVCVPGAGALAITHPTAPPVARTVAWALGAEYLGRAGARIQQGDDDCGIAAMQMVLEARGVAAQGLDSARAVVLARGEGASFGELRALAGRSGVRAEGWKLDGPALARAPMPAIVHFPDHYVVVDAVEADGSVLARDPGIGRVRYPAARFAELWTGHVLVFPAAAASAAAIPARDASNTPTL
ncbi:MAG: hypothetical protein JWM27_2810 [Gemmatimonadetes bacterium]|nr:hypothetical protein [Gemmatimonadota bacterium]